MDVCSAMLQLRLRFSQQNKTEPCTYLHTLCAARMYYIQEDFSDEKHKWLYF